MAFRYSRPAMTGAAIFTLAGVTVLPLAQANAAPVSPQDEARSGATQGQPNSAAQNGQQQGANANGQGQQGANASGQNQDGATQDQQQSANAGGQGQQAPQSRGASSASQNGQGQQQGQPGASQDKQGTNASGQGQQAPQSRGASSASQNGQGQQQGQPSASQDQQQSANASGQGQQQGANANGQGQQAQGAPASQSSSNSNNSASQNNQSRQSQPSAPAKQSSGYATITSVDGFIDPQKTNNSLSVGITGVDNTHRIISDLRVQELDEFGNIVNDDVNTVGGASSNDSEGNLGISVVVDGTKINPNHQYRLYLDVFDQDTLTRSYAYYPVVVWKRSYIPVVPLSAAQ